jgi:predicted nucleic acid-binding protein
VTLFADSSALVKLYVNEPGHQAVRAAGDLFVVSQLARVEVPAALWRKQRSGDIALGTAAVLVTEFEFDFLGDGSAPPRFVAVKVADDIVEVAARQVARHGLRAYDAVQLACATAARELLPTLNVLAAFGQELRRAAAAEGFALLPALA